MSKYNEVMDKVKVTDDMRKRILQNIENADTSNVTSFEVVKKKKENKIVPFIRRYGALAAMFAVVLVGAYAVFGTVGRHEMGSSAPAGSYEMAETATMTESATEEAMIDAAPEAAMEAPAAPAAGSDKAKSEINSTPMPAMEAMEEADEMEEDSDSAFEVTATEFASALELSENTGAEIYDIESLLARSAETHYLGYENGMAEISYLVDGDSVSLKAVASANFDEFFVEGDVVSEKAVGDYTVTLWGEGKTVKTALWNTENQYYYLSSDNGMTEDEMTELVSEVMEKGR
ncbi:hypothetical protein [Butyrivibrio sp. MC2021]|uniref:hypothetical protein n=1 Tax=Butyrivibrio sp. MC2021 TaxID=1408306 RepID=UPI00047D82C2|nr:hypothetical protein [Butyrivibrio sp. MC2021]